MRRLFRKMSRGNDADTPGRATRGQVAPDPGDTPSNAEARAAGRAQTIPDQHVIELLRLGNVHRQWTPMLLALRSGYMDTGQQRPDRNGHLRPTFLAMIIIRAPLGVIREAVAAGAKADPDHLPGAAASGDTDKLDYLLSLGVRPAGMSIPAEHLLLAAVNSGSLDMLEKVWGLHRPWNLGRAREELRVFDCAMHRRQAKPVLRYLLARGIGPSSWLLDRGGGLPTGVAGVLASMGWPVPPVSGRAGGAEGERRETTLH